jgi:hypothetical protein
VGEPVVHQPEYGVGTVRAVVMRNHSYVFRSVRDKNFFQCRCGAGSEPDSPEATDQAVAEHLSAQLLLAFDGTSLAGRSGTTEL